MRKSDDDVREHGVWGMSLLAQDYVPFLLVGLFGYIFIDE